jgi:hypothetical protein
MFVTYLLFAYVLLWPRFLDEIGLVPVKGEFGSIQIGDIFLLLSLFLVIITFFSKRVQLSLSQNKIPIILIMLFVGYWVFYVGLLFLAGSGRQTLNQARSLIYYLFMLFLLARIAEPKEVKKLIRIYCYLVIPIFLMQGAFFVIHNEPSIKLFLSQNAPDFYRELYVDKRFMLTNPKSLFILFPFLYNLIFFETSVIKFRRSFHLILLACACFLFLIGQSRAMWLVITLGLMLSIFLFNHKKVLNYARVMKLIPVIVVSISMMIFFVVLTNFLVPQIADKLQSRAQSLTVENVQQYENQKAMGTLKSRIDSYNLLLSRLGNDYVFGKGLGHPINPHGDVFKLGVDSTYLMVLWSGGVIPLFLLILFQFYTFLQSWNGYVKASSDFDIYFFTSSTVSLISIFIIALRIESCI